MRYKSRMKIPNRLQPLVDDGLIDNVLQRLKSGKEADVYTVLCGDHIQCAKVYKEASQRSFKQAVQYQEGRKVRNTRDARAMQKGSRFGRKQQEEVWHTAEVDALFRLANAGVRVPQPYMCLDGVLLMELVTDADGAVAPRLSDVSLSQEQALADFDTMIDRTPSPSACPAWSGHRGTPADSAGTSHPVYPSAPSSGCSPDSHAAAQSAPPTSLWLPPSTPTRRCR